MKYKILVVDDDKELVKMLCSYFNMKLQTGEGPEGDRGCKTGKTERLSEMPALQGE